MTGDHEFRIHEGTTLAGTLTWRGNKYPKNQRNLTGTYPLQWHDSDQRGGAVDEAVIMGSGPEHVSTREEFAQALDILRQKAGLTTRQVADAVKAPHGTVGGYFGGRHLPPASQTELFIKILHVCGVHDTEQVRGWVDALVRVRRAPGRRPATAAAPYRGLECFQPEHADWFFGRETFTQGLLERLANQPAQGGLLMLIGPSGSGKSSVLRAGLIPALNRQDGSSDQSGSLLFTPGAHPVRALADQLAGLAQVDVEAIERDLWSRPAEYGARIRREVTGQLVVVVDQFEEIFTLCSDEAERQAFVAALDVVAGPAGNLGAGNGSTQGSVWVVAGMRADFYASALRYPRLAAAVQNCQVIVQPMTEAGLRRAIIEPARKAKLELEDGLVELLLRDLGPARNADAGDTHAAGTLPLLSHALLATWERGRKKKMTVEDYQSSGAIAGAVSQTAEAIYTELSSTQQNAARRLFLRLVHVGEDTTDTRRRVRADELIEQGDDPDSGATGQVLDRYIERRLITVDEDTVEISHEALIMVWPRLRNWIGADRVGLRTHRQLTESAQAWHDADRDPDTLYRGGRLATAIDWVSDQAHQADLNTMEQEFLEASTARERAEHLSARRRTRRLRRYLAVSVVVTVIAGVLAVIAFQQSSRANTERDRAISRQMAITADRLRATDPALAAQLALAAYQISPTIEARSSIIASSGTPTVTRMMRPGGARQAVAISPDGRLLAAGGAAQSARSDTAILLWDLTNPQDPRLLGRPLTGHTNSIYAVAFSPDGRTLATGGADNTVRMWNVTDPAQASPLGAALTGPQDRVLTLEFSADGTTLAAGGRDKAVRLWNVTEPAQPRAIGQPLLGAGGAVQAVSFSPDGRTLATADAAGAAHLWDISDPGAPRSLSPALSVGSKVNAVAFSPDGTTLAVGSNDGMVRLWTISDSAPPTPVGPPLAAATGWVTALAFTSDGHTIAVANADSAVQLWNWTARRLVAALPHSEPVTAVAFRHNDQFLITNSADGIARVWTVPGPVLPATDRAITAVTFHPGGHLLATAGSDVQLAQLPDRHRPQTIEPVLTTPSGLGRMDGTVAISPDGCTLAAGTRTSNEIVIWDITNPRTPTQLGAPLTGPTALIQYLAFSPNGRILAAASDDGTIRLWNITNPREPKPSDTLTPPGGGTVSEIAFSPDGTTLAAATSIGTVALWDIDDSRPPAPIGSPITVSRDIVDSLAFNPNGDILATGSDDGTVRLWDITNREQPTQLGQITGPDGYVKALTFNPKDHTLAGGTATGQIWIWEISNPKQPQTLAHLNPSKDTVWSLTFSPDGRTLASTNEDLRLWETNPSQIATQICATAGDTITEDEWKSYIPEVAYRPACH